MSAAWHSRSGAQQWDMEGLIAAAFDDEEMPCITRDDLDFAIAEVKAMLEPEIRARCGLPAGCPYKDLDRCRQSALAELQSAARALTDSRDYLVREEDLGGVIGTHNGTGTSAATACGGAAAEVEEPVNPASDSRRRKVVLGGDIYVTRR